MGNLWNAWALGRSLFTPHAIGIHTNRYTSESADLSSSRPLSAYTRPHTAPHYSTIEHTYHTVPAHRQRPRLGRPRADAPPPIALELAPAEPGPDACAADREEGEPRALVGLVVARLYALCNAVNETGGRRAHVARWLAAHLGNNEPNTDCP